MPSLTILVFIQQSSPFAETFDENLTLLKYPSRAVSSDLCTNVVAALFAGANPAINAGRVTIAMIVATAAFEVVPTDAWIILTYQQVSTCKSTATCKFITGMVSSRAPI